MPPASNTSRLLVKPQTAVVKKVVDADDDENSGCPGKPQAQSGMFEIRKKQWRREILLPRKN